VKIVLITHHFPPRYSAGAELYAYRIAHELRRQQHSVEVVCVESVTEGALAPTCITDPDPRLPVHRLYFDVRRAPDPFEWSFRNPELGRWCHEFLRTVRPDVVHVNSGYLLGGAVPEAAFELSIPTVLTLHDYWFMCPRIILRRTDGRVCGAPAPPNQCAWCLVSQKRRYHLPDRRLSGRLGSAFIRLSRSETAARMMGAAPLIAGIVKRRWYLKQVLERVDLVIATSQFLKQKIDEYGFQPRRLVFLPFGLERADLADRGPRAPGDKLRIGYLGQLEPHKGVHLLLAAFRQLIHSPGACELILHGPPPEESRYQRVLSELAHGNPSIIFAGPYPNRQVGQVLSGLDVIVVPSLWYESRPTVIVEAQAARTVVVAARLGGAAELVRHDEDGLLFETGCVESLAGQLQRLLDEPGLLARLQAGIRPVPTITEEATALITLYESLSDGPAAR
jgi:glycosyltransferase involved in cell wall biosynthesis